MATSILFVGDHDFLESVRAVQGREFQAISAPKIDDAVEAVRRSSPCLVLLDTRLSNGRVPETCRRLKSLSGEPPQVIAISPTSNGLDEIGWLEAGADDYLGGPFTAHVLLSKVRLHLRLRAAMSSLKPACGPVPSYASELEKLVAQRARTMVASDGLSMLTLTTLAESRELFAEDRLLRMRYYSSILAAELAHKAPELGRIDVKFLEQLYRAVPLHDIGKIAISDSILLKQGALTPVERKTMEEHTTIGAVILEQLVSHTEENDFLGMATVLARWHHEHFDGTGYPSRLAGREIPLPARIVALADVYDALTTRRPYREIQTPEAARAMIQQQSGKQFDPAVVDAFHSRFADFLQVQAHFDRESPTLMGAARFLE